MTPTDTDRSASFPAPDQVWYTPSCLPGRMIVNRETGTVEYFRLGLAAEATLKVHITVAHTGRTMDSHDIVRVDRMELVGGNLEPENHEIAWDESITHAAASRRLKRIFYKFEEIEWVPFTQALAVAKEKNRPIFAMVLWGNLDDQSC